MTGATFDRFAFEVRVEQIGEMLGDLWAVDTFLESTGEALFDGGYVDLRIGKTHPFTKRIFVPSEQIVLPYQEFQHEVEAQGTAWGREAAAWLRATLKEIVEAQPAEFEPAVSSFRDGVGGRLEELVPDDFGMLQKSLGDWEGQTADKFADYFYNLVPDCARGQNVAALGMAAGLAGIQAVINQAQHSAMELVEALWRALDEMLLARQAAHAPIGSSSQEWLMIGGAILGLVAAIPTGGTSLVVAQGIAGSLSALIGLAGASTVTGESTQVMRVLTGTAEDAFERMASGVDDLLRTVNETCSGIADYTIALRQQLDRLEADGRLWPPRPNVLDSATPQTFHHESLNYS